MKNFLIAVVAASVSHFTFAQQSTTNEWIEKGKKAYTEKAFGEAVKYFKEAAKSSPMEVEPYFRMGISYIELENWKEAEKVFQTALGIDPSDRDCWNDLGFVYNRTGRYDQAIPCFEKTISLAPDIPNPYAHLGYAQLKKGDKAAAWSNFQLSASRSTDYNKNHFYLACYYATDDNNSKALESLEMAINKGFADKSWIEEEKALKALRKETQFVLLLGTL